LPLGWRRNTVEASDFPSGEADACVALSARDLAGFFLMALKFSSVLSLNHTQISVYGFKTLQVFAHVECSRFPDID
jgi:hypothetical protein